MNDHHHLFPRGLTPASSPNSCWSICPTEDPLLFSSRTPFLTTPAHPSSPPPTLHPNLLQLGLGSPRLPINHFCVLPLPQPAKMLLEGRGHIIPAYVVPTTGATQAKQLTWTRALNHMDLKSFRTSTSWHFTIFCPFAVITGLHLLTYKKSHRLLQKRPLQRDTQASSAKLGSASNHVSITTQWKTCDWPLATVSQESYPYRELIKLAEHTWGKI